VLETTTLAIVTGTGSRQRLMNAFLARNETVWRRLPPRIRDTRQGRAYGAWLHALVRRHADREMYLGTSFLRNRPELELMGRLAQPEDPGAPLKIAVLGCSIGAEVYSILWTLRSGRPDLDLTVDAVDISPEVLQVAERGVYSDAASELVHSSIFSGLTDAERRDMFDWDGDDGTIKPWLRDGVTWQLGDAADPGLITRLGSQDLVVASNFLCHLPAASALACLRNLAQLVRPGGCLFVTGVDLDVRTQVARELGWQPVRELRAEIHDGDRLVRSDWPWRWWGLEPLDDRRADWEMRYTAAFQIGHGPARQPAGEAPAVKA
jgi:chemotaxis methyl-accepting protein methylase